MKTIDKAALVAVMAVSTAFMTGCGRTGARICADSSGRRLDDFNCESAGATGSHGGSWVYMSGRAPAIGGSISGARLGPEPGVSYGGAAPEGGVSRGGFGGTGEGIGGHGGFGE